MLKHIIYFLILICSCSLTTTVIAQSAPGLVGKRLTVSYDFNAYFNWSAPYDRGSNDISTIDYLFTSKHIFGVDYILSRTLSIGADFGFNRPERLDDVGLLGNVYARNRLRTTEIGIRAKYFHVERNGSIAPIGFYTQYRLMRFSYRSELEVVIENELDEPFTFDYVNETVYTGSFGFGRQGIIFSNIMYNVGCEMALVLPKNFSFDSQGVDEDIRNSLILSNMFKLKFGIVVPIF